MNQKEDGENPDADPSELQTLVPTDPKRGLVGGGRRLFDQLRTSGILGDQARVGGQHVHLVEQRQALAVAEEALGVVGRLALLADRVQLAAMNEICKQNEGSEGRNVPGTIVVPCTGFFSASIPMRQLVTKRMKSALFTLSPIRFWQPSTISCGILP